LTKEENSQPVTDGELQATIPIAIANQLQLENMEVHKHPHQVAHKKKWPEYILEFFMLFLAVFLGFVAENVRENIVERRTETHYIKSMIEDLRKDTAMLNRIIDRTERITSLLDTTERILFSVKLNDSLIKKTLQFKP